jgi:GNAT superfamily N-acetyltransferase
MINPATLAADALMNVHINTLYLCDDRGRLVAVNEDGAPLAPLFYMGRTPQGNVWRFRHDLPAVAQAQLDRLCRAEPITQELAPLPQHYAAIRAVIAEFAPQHHQVEYRGPAYWIPESAEGALTAPHGAEVVLLTAEDAYLIPTAFAWMLPLSPTRGIDPVVVTVENGQAVAVCFCARRPGQATEAGVETLPACRGKGYATATVATWAAEVRRRGVLPMYSTAWDNFASQAIARKLGMVLYGEDWSIR